MKWFRNLLARRRAKKIDRFVEGLKLTRAELQRAAMGFRVMGRLFYKARFTCAELAERFRLANKVSNDNR